MNFGIFKRVVIGPGEPDVGSPVVTIDGLSATTSPTSLRMLAEKCGMVQVILHWFGFHMVLSHIIG